ncbi:MAG TPA: helix-turn-helix domain-containing protein, partial [Enhygromyxa sp.]|nr:helix-turn-helix domain-containing protein [Enhygromyxa sp.]
ELCRAEIDLRRVQAKSALAALLRAEQLAVKSRIPALVVEVRDAVRLASQPAARLISNDDERLLTLGDVERLFGSDALIIDGCRRLLRQGSRTIPLARRPILFALLERLGEQAAGASREALILAAFGARRSNDSHRARLRVEIGRLRKLVRPLCDVEATRDGFRLLPTSGTTIQVLRPPLEGKAAALQALLADGQAWSTSALALALGESQRNVQRALADLMSAGRVRATGRGRARRWLAPPLSGFTTTLLLPLNVAGG